jgi:hypothetical protein
MSPSTSLRRNRGSSVELSNHSEAQNARRDLRSDRQSRARVSGACAALTAASVSRLLPSASFPSPHTPRSNSRFATHSGAATGMVVFRRPAGTRRSATARNDDRTALGTVVVHTPLGIGDHAGQTLRAIVVDATLEVGWRTRLTFRPVVVGAPATPAAPFVAQFRKVPVTAIEDGPGRRLGADASARKHQQKAGDRPQCHASTSRRRYCKGFGTGSVSGGMAGRGICVAA